MNLTKAELYKFRALLLFAAFAVFGWGVFIDQTVDEKISGLTARSLNAAFCVLCLFGTFLRPITRRSSDILSSACAFLMLLTSAWMLALSDYHLAIVVGDILLIMTAMSVIRSRPLAIVLNLFFYSNIVRFSFHILKP